MRRLATLALLGGLAAAIARRLQGSRQSPPPSGAGAAGTPGEATQSPPVAAGEQGGMPAGARRPAPADAPGPSVNPTAGEAAGDDALRVDLDPDLIDQRTDADALEAQAEAEAAAAAARIGGEAPTGPGYEDEAMRAVYEAGGGEAEGFEQAEEELIRNATHDDGRGKPLKDAFAPELEADASTGVYGEADHVHSTEQVDDDEGRGTGRPADEGRRR